VSPIAARYFHGVVGEPNKPARVSAAFGLDQSHTIVLSTVLIGAMFLAFAGLVQRVPAGTGLVLALAACSPAVMFAVERANMDIALFTLLVVSILLWRAFPAPAQILSPMLVLLAATAKLYPVFALPAFLFARSRLAARAALVCAAAFLAYVLYNRHDVAHVAEIATQGQYFSYGSRILLAHLYHQVGADRWAGPAAVKQLLAAIPIALIAIAIAIRVHRLRRVSAAAEAGAPWLVAFHVGALIYLGTFALANNFDYRLVFLLLTLPQIIAWAGGRVRPVSSLAATTLVMILVMLWVGSLSRWLNLWDELVCWAVAGLLVALIVATLPCLELTPNAHGQGAA
jgi:hypothetical protein